MSTTTHDDPSKPRPTAAELLALIAAGATVDVITYTRAWRVDRKVVAKFAKANMPIFKDAADGRLLMASGRRYVDCSGTAIRITT